LQARGKQPNISRKRGLVVEKKKLIGEKEKKALRKKSGKEWFGRQRNKTKKQ